MGTVMLFNDGWEFSLDDQEDFRAVEIPHDWLIADTSNFYKDGNGTYRRKLDAGFLREGQQRGG